MVREGDTNEGLKGVNQSVSVRSNDIWFGPLDFDY